MYTRISFAILICLTWINLHASEIDSDRQRKGEIFSVHDINKDGVLDKAEYEQFVMQRARRLSDSDRPRHGYSSHLNFEEIDKDNDGYLTEDELVLVLNKRLRKQRRIRSREGQW